MSALTRAISVPWEKIQNDRQHNRICDAFGELAWETAQIFPVVPDDDSPHWTPARILEVERRWPCGA